MNVPMGKITRGLDNPVLVGLCGITVPLAIGETLHHLLLRSLCSCVCFFRVFRRKKKMRRKKL